MAHDEDLVGLAAEWSLGRLAPETLIDLAVEALQAGCDDPGVAYVASLSGHPRRAEVEGALRPVLLRRGVELPTRWQAMALLIERLTARVDAGELDPTWAAGEIESLWGYNREPADQAEQVVWGQLAPLIQPLADWNDAIERGESQRAASANEEILAEMRLFLARGGLRLPAGLH